MNKPNVWLNGKIIPWHEANVPILSHGFSRGSAVFEAFGTHEGPDGTLAFRMDAHLARLKQTVKLLGMELKYSIEEIAHAVAKIASINNSGRGLVKIMAYWGEEAIINLILKSKLDVAIFAIPASEELGLDKVKPISACISKWRKLHPETIPVQAKACANYLNGYLIRKDANDRGFDIGLSVGTDGFVAEGSIESIFIVKDGILKTPPLGRILASITRDSIIKIANANDIKIEETILQKEDLFSADEMFTSHTGIKVTPIKRFEENELQAPGSVTTIIMELMDNTLNFKDKSFYSWFQKLY
ncbi:MAG: aminotransferase class IV [Proteobacteria bacterium]|nr:aminotransferase class IV [Pseudomonadota bacterium]